MFGWFRNLRSLDLVQWMFAPTRDKSLKTFSLIARVRNCTFIWLDLLYCIALLQKKPFFATAWEFRSFFRELRTERLGRKINRTKLCRWLWPTTKFSDGFIPSWRERPLLTSINDDPFYVDTVSRVFARAISSRNHDCGNLLPLHIHKS